MRTGWISALDPLSYHGGCDVKKGEKWVANIWINVVGDGKEEFKAWKMGTNWLAENKQDKQIVNTLINKEVTKEIKEATFENRYVREKNLNDDEARTERDAKNKDSVLMSKIDEEPKSMEVKEANTPAPLPLTKEQVTLDQTKPPTMGPLPPPNVEGNKVVTAILLLLEELDRVEMEILARFLHERMKLVCVPLMINPMGSVS